MSRILFIAILLDLIIGDPPNRLHPVAWMGSLIMALRRKSPEQGRFIYGGLITYGGALTVGILTIWIIRVCGILPSPLNQLAQAWLLKTTFSIMGLSKASHDVEDALRAEDIQEARRILSWHLVSRDTSTLSESQVVAATIESLAENTSDGVIAPLYWYAIGGIPVAFMYRYVQTCDSILGYRDVEREWLGKISARTDDVLNLIPARLTAIVFVILRPQAWSVWRRDKSVTASPNAGHPMSAMAGALNVELEKVDHYQLNAGAPQPMIQHIQQTRWLMLSAIGVFSCLLMFILRSRDD